MTLITDSANPVRPLPGFVAVSWGEVRVEGEVCLVSAYGRGGLPAADKQRLDARHSIRFARPKGNSPFAIERVHSVRAGAQVLT